MFNNTAVIEFVLKESNFDENVTYVIYGTQEIAQLYYDVLYDLYGDNAIDFFIDSSLQAPKRFCNHPVLHIAQIKQHKKNNQIYIIAAFHNEQDRMIDNLKENGIDEKSILPPIIYFRDDYIAKYLEKSRNIYFYNRFNSILEIKNWIEETSFYLDYEDIDVTFNYVCNEINDTDNIDSKVHIIRNTFKYPETIYDIIIVTDFESIHRVKAECVNPILCIDNRINTQTKPYVYTAISNYIYGIPDYQVYYKNNFKQLVKVINTTEGILLCGNGPSLGEGITKNKRIIDRLFPIACNNIYQAEDIMEELNPRGYMLSDQGFFRYEKQDMLRSIVDYVNHHDCYFIFPKKWERMIVEKLKVNKDKMIAFEFVRDQIYIPDENNLKCCPAGTVVLTMGVPIGIACDSDIYFIGCDGQKIEGKEVKWEYQKGLDNSKLSSKTNRNSLIGPGSKTRMRATMDMENSYSKLLMEVERRGKKYCTLTHSNFSILEKRYLKEQ